MTTAATTILTAEEFAERFMDVPGVELERGRVIYLSPGYLAHSGCSENASFLLGAWARRTGLGKVYTNETGLITARDPDSVRGADVIYYSFKRLPKKQRPPGFSKVPPELVVEVVGRGRTWRALVAKAEEYLRMGADRVWVLDPGKKTVHVVRTGQPPVKLDAHEELRDEAILPGFSCRVAEFFED